MINDKVERRSMANHLRNQKQLIIAAVTSYQTKAASDIKNIDQKIFKSGQEWFKCGLSLEEAPLEIQKNPSFVKGFERGRRTQLVEEELYKTGVKFFQQRIPFSNIPDMYIDNDIVKRRYTDAMNNNQKK